MMTKFKYITLVISFCFLSGQIFGQAAALKRAQTLMDNLAYQQAIEEYNQIVDKYDVAEAKINLAEAYRKIGDSDNAELWYSYVVRLPEASPIHNLYYGQMLQRNGKCDIARDWYNKYVELVPDDQRGQYLSRACDYEEELMQKNNGIYEIMSLDINSNVDDISPAIYKNNLLFSSEREQLGAIQRESAWTGHEFLKIYTVDRKQQGEGCGNYVYSRPEAFNGKIESKYHDAAVAFNKKQDEIFFTRNNFLEGKTGKSDDGIIKLKVYYASSAGEDKWNDLQSLPFNSEEYSIAHPTLSEDGKKLYFSSDMPGGFGEFDIYVSEKESGRWGPPMNLGPTINTEGTEIFPSFEMATGRLYFSSDGHVGLGGLDIHYVVDKGEGEWSQPENLGFPLNSIADDFGIVFNESGTCGYFTSDREGGAGGDDIYSFKKVAIPMELFVFNVETGEPIEGAQVVVGCKETTMVTGTNGKIVIDIKPGDSCDFDGTAEGFEPNSVQGFSEVGTTEERIMVELPLTPESDFELIGTVFDKESAEPIEGAKVTLTNDCDEEEQVAYTDINGQYEFKLSKECCYDIRAEKTPTYLAGFDKEKCTRGLEESERLESVIKLQPTIYTGEPDNSLTNNDNSYTYQDPVTKLWIDKNTEEFAKGEYPDGKFYDRGRLTQNPDNGGAYTDNTTPVDEDDNINWNNPSNGGSTTSGNAQIGEHIGFLLHIYYDYNQSYIRDDAEPELEKLLTTLNDNPTIIVEIGSHTDARGGSRFNDRLSQRRAESVVRWLVGQGVDRSRLIARGYGETATVNDCTNNVPCSEREHQLNRRTEFKVVGCSDCRDENNERLSTSRENDETLKINECVGCPF